MGNEYNAALYCRLSKDDFSEGESSSIVTPKMMLYSYRHPEEEKHINSIHQSVIESCMKKKLLALVKLFHEDIPSSGEKGGARHKTVMQKHVEKILIFPQKRKNARQESRVQIMLKK